MTVSAAIFTTEQPRKYRTALVLITDGFCHDSSDAIIFMSAISSGSYCDRPFINTILCLSTGLDPYIHSQKDKLRLIEVTDDSNLGAKLEPRVGMTPAHKVPECYLLSPLWPLVVKWRV